MALPTAIGRYRVLASLGAGAMGALVRARDERLGRDVAIKRVKNLRGLAAAIFLARFEAEARALAALSHPGVVAVYDSGVDDDVPFLVMELLAGPSLKGALVERGPLPLAEVVAIGIQLARALEAAHARGIVHRDVKPANVVRHADGSWKLVDFGVAHLPDSSVTLTGQFLGTPAYAAPEALATGTTSPRSDVWSLAATLVELATGASARPDATLAEVIAKSERPVLDDTAAARLGPLAPVLAPALAIDPATRPDAATLARALADVPLERASASASLPMASAPVSLPMASAPVSLPAMPIAAAPSRTSTWIGLGVGAVLLIGLIGLGRRCDGASPDVASSRAPGAPSADDAPTSFEAPPDLDDKAARDWRKLAEKIERGELRPARDKLREFERKHGVSPQSLRLRTWLEAVDAPR